MPHLIVIYGPPLAGKSSLAREVAGRLAGKSSIVSIDGILQDAIRNPDRDALAELEMVHIQARLLVANFLKNRYHVVLEGAFCYLRDGVMHHREHEVDQIVALMRNLASAPLVVGLSATDATLRQRSLESGASSGADAAVAVSSELRPSRTARSLVLETDGHLPVQLARMVLERLDSRAN